MKALKKSALVIALIASAAGAQAADVYGNIDAGVNYRRVDGAAVSAVSSGQSNDSFIGVKAAEDLGGGLKVGVTLEAGVNVDDGTTNSKLFNREASLGLASGGHSLKLGRTETLSRAALRQFDVFGGGTYGTARSITDTAGDYADNSVAYSYLHHSGFSAAVSHSLGEQVDGGLKDGSVTAVQVGYARGPVAASVVHTKVDAGSKTTLVGGSYDFGIAKASAMYQDATNSSLDRSFVVGVKAPVKSFNVLANVGQAKMADGEKIDLYSLGGEYNLSKRTNLYAAYGRLDADVKAEQVSLGVNHRF